MTRGVIGALAMLLAVVAGARAQEGIRIDGHLDEAAWREAAVITDFVQGEPVEGSPAEAATTVRILFQEDGIYVGARMAEPLGGDAIARQLVRRDDEGQADHFEVAFDPNRDRRTGYAFRVSAAGVQRDAYLHNDDDEDSSWDAVWESEAAVDADGWTAEVRIPWSQIRYDRSPEEQTWGINFVRWRVAAGERTYHALVPRNERGRVSFFRPYTGIRLPSSSRRVELRPYVLGRARTAAAEVDDPFFDGREAEADVGLDVRYGLGSAFTLDATVNPDFGQVELDPAVINLSAFETFFDERRPFFVEDARIFDFGLAGFGNQLFYSRRIGREPQGSAPSDAEYADIPVQSTILGAAKLTGRTVGGLSLGALVAVTDAEAGRAAFVDQPGEPTFVDFLAQPRTWHGVGRAQQDLRDGATVVGGIVTALRRDLPDDGMFDFLPSTAFSAGVDFEHLWNDRQWSLEGYFAGTLVTGDTTALIGIQRSSTHYFQRPDSRFAVDSSLTTMVGASWRLGLERQSGPWAASASLAQTSPGFDVNDLGFSRSGEQMEANVGIEYREIEPGELFRDYSVALSTFQSWRGSVLDRPFAGGTWGRAHKDGSAWIEADWTLNNFWGGFAEYAYRPETLDDAATRGGPLMVAPHDQKLEARIHSDRRRSVSMEVSGLVEKGPALTNVETGVSVAWRPSPRLELEVEPEYSATTFTGQYVATFEDPSYETTFGARYLFAELDRRTLSLETRLDVTFTRDLTLQLFLQPLLDAGEYTSYKQLERPSSFSFLDFEPGTPEDTDGDGVAERCAGGTICELEGVQHVDLDGDGTVDRRFRDRDFNVVSLRGNAVLRWEYRPGSTIYLVWQQRRFDSRPFGDFDIGRDRGDLLDLHPDNQFIIKVNYWIGL